MRTTLAIDDDVLQAAKELALREGVTMGQIISRLARQGLTAASANSKKSFTLRVGVPLLPSRDEIVTPEHIQRLMDQEGMVS